MSQNANSHWNKRLKAIMPWGSSTGSKSPNYLPEEPSVIVKGKGCRVWDADGREFIDYRNGLGPISLGYQFPEVNEAIKEQLNQGIVFGHPHPLECEVAELLSEIIPCAENVRFLKTGGEALAACIRIARHYTGRDHIIQIGYNGWLNSLGTGAMILPRQAATKAPEGVPRALSELHHVGRWNDIELLEDIFKQYEGQIAAVVVAADYADMASGETFYPAIRELTEEHGSLLILDEIVTGFRIAMGGVQEYFGIVPDMSVFSKGMANGMPISAYVGKKDVMDKCNRGESLSISSTFGGESLSLAAAKATIEVYKKEDVVAHLWKQGKKLWSGVNYLFDKYNIPIEVKGLPPCPSFVIEGEEDLQEKFFRAAYKNGVSLYNVSYVNFSHRDKDIEETLERLDRACSEII